MGKNWFSADDVIQLNLQNAKKITPFISHTVDSRWTKFALFSDTTLQKILNRSEFLFSFLFLPHKMAPNGTVSHEFSTTNCQYRMDSKVYKCTV